MRMKNSENSSLSMWCDQFKLWPFHFVTICILILVSIPFSLGMIVLLPYFIQAINSTPVFLTWNKLLGTQLSLFIQPIIQGTTFEHGFSIHFQKEWFCFILILVSLVYGFLNYKSDSMLRDYGEKIAKNYRTKIIKKYLSLNFNQATQFDAGLLSAMVGEDMREVQQSFTRLISSLLKDGLTSFVFILWLIFLDYQLFALFIAILIPAGIVLRITGKVLKRLSKQGLQFESELLSGLLERMRGWQTIQVHKAITFELINFNKINNKIYHVWRRATRARALGSPMVEWLGIVAGVFIIIVALKRISDGYLSSQILTGFIVTIGFLSDKINRMATQLNTTRKGTDAFHRIQSFLSTQYAQENQSLPFEDVNFNLMNEKNIIELQNIFISVEQNTPLIENLSLKVCSGDLVAIIGHSGIGKSTLVRILLGIQNPEKGSVLLNNLELHESDYKNISSKIGFIPQEPFLFSGSIFENITYPQKIDKPSALLIEQAESALKLANLDKNLFESINGLSGGEKQRLMFSRLFFNKPNLIIIDEGTSALDLQNEQRILENLKEFSKHAITFIVAHRPLVQNYATHILDLTNFKRKY